VPADFRNDVQISLGREGRVAEQDFVQNHPQAPEIAPHTVTQLLAHLRGEILGRSAHCDTSLVALLAVPKIAEHDVPLGVEHQALGRDESVHDSLSVQRLRPSEEGKNTKLKIECNKVSLVVALILVFNHHQGSLAHLQTQQNAHCNVLGGRFIPNELCAVVD